MRNQIGGIQIAAPAVLFGCVSLPKSSSGSSQPPQNPNNNVTSPLVAGEITIRQPLAGIWEYRVQKLAGNFRPSSSVG